MTGNALTKTGGEPSALHKGSQSPHGSRSVLTRLSNSFPSRRSWRYVLAAVWFLFTISLTGWWVVFGLSQIDALMQLEHADTARLVRQHKMLLWEGATLFLSLTAGAIALAYFMMRERAEASQVQRFLATFTHELRTPLASLRLQAEALQEELSEVPGAQKVLLDRLVSDTSRLTLQLDNSLFLADVLTRTSHIGPDTLGGRSSRNEELVVSSIFESLRHYWPQLTIAVSGDALVRADRRAVESIVQNLLQNAVTHGKAKQVQVTMHEHQSGRVMVSVSNTGKAFNGSVDRLGKLFERFYSGSGSGIGLYVVKSLMRGMQGDVSIRATHDTFCVDLVFIGTLTHEATPSC